MSTVKGSIGACGSRSAPVLAGRCKEFCACTVHAESGGLSLRPLLPRVESSQSAPFKRWKNTVQVQNSPQPPVRSGAERPPHTPMFPSTVDCCVDTYAAKGNWVTQISYRSWWQAYCAFMGGVYNFSYLIIDYRCTRCHLSSCSLWTQLYEELVQPPRSVLPRNVCMTPSDWALIAPFPLYSSLVPSQWPRRLHASRPPSFSVDPRVLSSIKCAKVLSHSHFMENLTETKEIASECLQNCNKTKCNWNDVAHYAITF